MKKITFAVMVMFLSLSFFPAQASAASTKEATSSVIVANPAEVAKVKVLELRLNEINDMDKSDLKSSEKRELRKEVRSIKQQLHEMGHYVYISAGAVILIVILLIILL